MGNKKRMIRLAIIFMLAFIVGCGGSSTGNPDTGESLSTQSKAYYTAFQIPFDILNNMGGGSPIVVPKLLRSKTVEDNVECDANLSSCSMYGDEGLCTVSVTNHAEENGFIFTLECENFAFTDSEGVDILVDGIYSADITYSGNESNLTVTMLITTPEGFSIIVDGEKFIYGSDFDLGVTTQITTAGDGSYTFALTFNLSGTVNSESVAGTLSIICTGSETGSEPMCTETM